MKNSRISGLLLLSLGSPLILLAAQSREWSTYRNQDFGYEIEYPVGWEVIEARPRADDAVQRDGEVLLPGIQQAVTFREPEGRLWPGAFLVRVHHHDPATTLDEWADSTNTDVQGGSLVTGSEAVTMAGRGARRFSIFAFDHTAIAVALVHESRIYELGYAGSNPNDPDIEEHASTYEHMLESFRLLLSAGPQADSFDLGGPCDEGLGSTLSNYYREFTAAYERGDHEELIDLQKRYVRAMCSNLNRWYGLAQVYLGADRPEMAVRVLEEAHRRGAEIKPSTFEYHRALATFIGTPAFQETALGQELQRLRSQAAQRSDTYRQQLDAVDPSSRPPERYVAEGACPFECCTFREWEVLETTRLVEEPNGTVAVGSAVKGQWVQGVTGEVHLRPEPVAVVYDHPPFGRGEIIFLLDYVGEGFSRYWQDGEIAEGELQVEDFCLRPGRSCWAEYIRPLEARQEPRWWVLIETEDGVEGWTDRPEHFGNKDACG